MNTFNKNSGFFCHGRIYGANVIHRSAVVNPSYEDVKTAYRQYEG